MDTNGDSFSDFFYLSNSVRNQLKRISESLKNRTRKGVYLVTGDLPNVSFSPESGGRVNPSKAMDEMRTQGMMRLLK